MKKIIFQFYESGGYLETSFEIVNKYLNKGFEVDYYYLGDSVPYQFYTSHRVHPFLKRLGVKTVPKKISSFFNKEKLNYKEGVPKRFISEDIKLNECEKLSDVYQIEYKGFNLGYGVASNLISNLLDNNPDIKDNIGFIELLYNSAVTVVNYVECLLKNELEVSTDIEVFLFNGRFCHERAVYEVCKKLNIPVVYFERGGNYHSYTESKIRPHDLPNLQKRFLSKFETMTEKEKEAAIKIGQEFFVRNRVKGTKHSQRQKLGAVPESIPKDKKIITYFSSTDDEYAALKDLSCEGFLDQLEVVQAIADYISDHPEYHFVLRVHPNLARSAFRVIDQWFALGALLSRKMENFTFIAPDSKYSSYSLIDLSHKILCYGSTTGVEAVYSGKRAMSLGPFSHYSELGLVEEGRTRSDIENFIKSSEKLKTSQDQVSLFGYYSSRVVDKDRIFSYEIFDYSNNFECFVRGVNIYSYPFLKNVNYFLYNLFNRFLNFKNRPNVLLFSGSSKMRKFVAVDSVYFNFIGILDNDEVKQNKTVGGLKVVSPKLIGEFNYDFILIPRSEYQLQKYRQLIKLGVDKKKMVLYHCYTNPIV